MNLCNERVWVAGGAGMFGSALSRNLPKENLLVTNRSDVDLSDVVAVSDWIQKNKPTILFLAAAKVGGIRANEGFPVDFLLENLKIQNATMEAAHQNGVRKLVFYGSACTYPKLSPQPIKEEELFNGKLEQTNIAYATAKLAGIELAKAYRRQYGFQTIVLMPTNTYGPKDNFDSAQSHVIPALIKKFHIAKIKKDPAVVLWGSGSPMREFIYVDDVALASIFLSENYNDEEIINIGTGEEISIFKLAKLIAQITGYDGKIEFDLDKPDGAPRKLLSSDRLRKLGWRPTVSLELGLKNTYDWAQKAGVLNCS